MGLLNFFGRGPLSPAKIAKMAKLAANPFAQPDVRMREMERLVEDGSALALQGLLRRFASNAQGHIADEEEKSWLEDTLVGMGQPAVASLQAYIRSESKLTYALRALERIVGREVASRFFLEVLQAYGPQAHRQDDAKLQLVLQLTTPPENSGAKAPASSAPAPAQGASDFPRALLPFLADHSDDVQWAVLDALHAALQLKAGAALLSPTALALREAALPTLQRVLLDGQGSTRIARRVAALCALHELSVEAGSVLPTPLGEEYWLDKKGIVRQRPKNTA